MSFKMQCVQRAIAKFECEVSNSGFGSLLSKNENGWKLVDSDHYSENLSFN